MSKEGASNLKRDDQGAAVQAISALRVQARFSNTAALHALRSPHAALLATLPTRVPRDAAAELVTRHFFRVSKRSLERWPVSVRLLNGRAHLETAELFDVAQRMCDQAPKIRGGLQNAAENT